MLTRHFLLVPGQSHSQPQESRTAPALPGPFCAWPHWFQHPIPATCVQKKKNFTSCNIYKLFVEHDMSECSSYVCLSAVQCHQCIMLSQVALLISETTNLHNSMHLSL